MKHIEDIVIKAVSPKLGEKSLAALGLYQTLGFDGCIAADSFDAMVRMRLKLNSNLLQSVLNEEIEKTISYMVEYYGRKVGLPSLRYEHEKLIPLVRWVKENLTTMPIMEILKGLHKEMGKIGDIAEFEVCNPKLVAKPYRVQHTSIAAEIFKTLPIQAQIPLESDDDLLKRFQEHWHGLSDDDKDAFYDEPTLFLEDLFYVATEKMAEDLKAYLVSMFGKPELTVSIRIEAEAKSSKLILNHVVYKSWYAFLEAYTSYMAYGTMF